jgi:hypothetical protein
MNLSSRVLVLSMAAALLMGCEGGWTSGGGVDSWSDAYNWVNFSGVYRGVGGGVLVTDYTATPGTPGVTNSVSGQNVDMGDGGNTYGGSLGHASIVPNSVTISAGGFTLTDNGSGVLSGGGGSGTISYGNGAWSINMGTHVINSGTPIFASYQYVVSGSSGSGAAGSGASGITIYSFTVQHQGQNISIVDNNGSTYSGHFGSISSTGGANQDNQTTPATGDSVTGTFEATGVSGAGFTVSIVGTFQGVVGAGDGTSFSLANRQMFGTWIEEGGRTGDVNGEASPIQVTVGTTPTATP